MKNRFDIGMQEDFNNMTYELGRKCLVYPRHDSDLTYEGQEGNLSGLGTGVTEVVFLQELDKEHEVVAAGQFDVGDVRFVFQSNTIAEEEGYVSPDSGTTKFKILKLTFVKNQSSDVITFVKAFGKKVPNR